MSKKGIFIFLSSFIKKIYLCNWWEQFNCQKNFLTLIFLKTLTYFFFNCVYLRFRDDSIYFHKTSYTGERNQIVTVINFWRWPLCPWTSKYKVQLRNNEKHGAVTQTVKRIQRRYLHKSNSKPFLITGSFWTLFIHLNKF